MAPMSPLNSPTLSSVHIYRQWFWQTDPVDFSSAHVGDVDKKKPLCQQGGVGNAKIGIINLASGDPVGAGEFYTVSALL
jgi:hypothetical protein